MLPKVDILRRTTLVVICKCFSIFNDARVRADEMEMKSGLRISSQWSMDHDGY